MQAACRILILLAFAVASAEAAQAADGQRVITQAKALAGNVTPGDAAGFPITITRAGSYILGGNLQPPADRNGIVVTAHDVTIDLNGFRLFGSGTAKHGIEGRANGLTVRNGTIADFYQTAISTPSLANGDYWTIEGMRLTDNYNGVTVNDFARVQNSNASSNGYFGIFCRDSCYIDNVIASKNGRDGIYVYNGGSVLNSTISNNTQYGLVALGQVAFGNNNLFGNGAGQIGFSPVPLHPNICNASAC